MNYLIYVERAAENLQFYLWHEDYTKRFASAKTSDKSLAPVWTQEMHDEAVSKIRRDNVGKKRITGPAAEMLKGTDFGKQPQELLSPRPLTSPIAPHSGNPFQTPPGTADGSRHDSMGGTTYHGSMASPTYKEEAASAFSAAGAKQPCTSFPECLSYEGGNANTTNSHNSTVP